MSRLIAIIDDEPDIAELVSIHLMKAGFQTKVFHEVKSFLSFIRHQLPDLLVLDLMLPDADGLDVCKSLKKEDRTGHIPIIILSAKGEETDRIIGLELGGDDYMTKPFSPKELVARVKAVLRRKSPATDSSCRKVTPILEIDAQKFETYVEGAKIELTSTEFRILNILANKPGRVYSRESLLDQLWGQDKIVLDRTIDVHIKNLRDKLGPAGSCIKNIRGIGYKLEP
ncbi:MAG: response regulator transcription factor [Candidatus Delongbacteria bacterium]|nr:response regulator transcription factor [Candidatus Delongbacteria bacterium]